MEKINGKKFVKDVVGNGSEFIVYATIRDGIGETYLINYKDFWFTINPNDPAPTTDLGLDAINVDCLRMDWDEINIHGKMWDWSRKDTSLITELATIKLAIDEEIETLG